MADKKKTTSRSQMAEPRPRASEKVASATVKATPREERKEQPKKEQPKKEQPKKEQPRQESKSTRRDAKSSPNMLQRFRNGRIGRFISEAYYELRHKVTWPTFIEARNMTFVVIVISVVIGAILGAVDYGLQAVFLAVSGR